MDKISFFLRCLRDEIQLPIRILNPTNINEAFVLAKIYGLICVEYKEAMEEWIFQFHSVGIQIEFE